MKPPTLTFLGTGNFLAPLGRYWNGFVVESEDVTALLEPSPTALPRLREAGYDAGQLDVVVISHFHPDHTFGWPFLLLELLENGPGKPLWVVGPPRTASFLEQMCELGSVLPISRSAHEALDIRYVEATPGSVQSAGPLAFEAVEVDHVAELDCFGYVLDLGGHRLAYSGDTKPCNGLDELAGRCHTLVVECNGTHSSRSHMDVHSALALRQAHPEPRMIATHLGKGVTAKDLPGLHVPRDLEQIPLG